MKHLHRISIVVIAALAIQIGVNFGARAAAADTKAAPAVRFPTDSEWPDVPGPLRKQDWFQRVWTERRTTFARGAEKEKGAVVFLGDSITQGWGSLAKDFPDLKVANRGISGDVTRGVLQRMKEDVQSLDPAAVVLLIGTNDLEEGADARTIVNNIALIVKKLKPSAKRPVIVCRVMPSHASKKRPAEAIREINAGLEKQLASRPHVYLCDTWSIFADAGGNARKEEFPDLLHPNGAGYSKFTAAVKPILESLRVQERQAKAAAKP